MSDLSFVAGEFPRLASTAREAAEAVRSARPEGGASAFASAMPGTSLSSQMQGVEDKFADQATKTGTSLDEHADSLEAAERDFIATEDENSQLIGSIIDGNSYGGGSGSGGGDMLRGHSIGSALSGHSLGGEAIDDIINGGGGGGVSGHSYGSGVSGHSLGGEAIDDIIDGGGRVSGHSYGSGISGHSYGSGNGDSGDVIGDPDHVINPHFGSRPGDWRMPDPIVGGPALPPEISEPIRGKVNEAVEGVKETVKEFVEGVENLDPSQIAGPIKAPDSSWLNDLSGK
ncbi:hypothetical protein [Isoptericola variabilis]|uniref:hypothetical protein n=1 Tax=Isoptericola variabilis TaxID=139208 RepID=UPI0006602524|nr:hypothetical protein [Isoptericola variabilis]